MSINNVITLDNNENYLLLEKAELNNINYFLAVKLNSEEEPTEEYKILEEEIENDETYVSELKDTNIINELLSSFTTSLQNSLDSLPDAE